MIRLFALGASDLLHDGEPRPEPILSQPKLLALLTYLLTARPGPYHSRDTLCALLWAESTQGRARAALSQALYVLRKALGPEAIPGRGAEEISVDTNLVWCDVPAFRSALARGDREDALRLYRGDLLPGLYLSDAPTWEAWLESERSVLRRSAAVAAWAEGVARSAGGDVSTGLGLFRRALTLGHVEEGAVREQMASLADRGEPAAALQLFDLLDEVMREGFDLCPSPESLALAEGVRQRGTLERLATVAGKVGGSQFSAAEEPSDEGAPDHGVERPESGPAPAVDALGSAAFPPPRRLVRTVLVAVVVVAAVAFGGLALGRVDPSGQAPWPGSRQRVVLSDFQTQTSDPALARAVTEAVRGALAQSAVVLPLDRRSVTGTLRRMKLASGADLPPTLAREVAAREGIPVVVEGTVNQVGGSTVLSARVVAAESGEPLASAIESVRDSTVLMGAVERLVGTLRADLGETLASVEASPPLERVTTASLPALEKYARALRIRSADPARSRSLLDEAVAIDPDFAMAHRWLATTGRPEAIERAYGLVDRATEPERYLIEGTYHQWRSHADSAIIAYRNLLDIDPENAVALWNLGLILYEEGDYRAAAEVFETYRRIHPDRVGPHHGLASARAAAGDTAGARAALAEVPDELAWLRVRELAELEWVTGHYAAADSLLEGAAASWPQASWVLRMRAGLAASRGRVEEAEELVRAGLVSDSRGPEEALRRSEAWLLASQALVRAYVLGDAEGARGVLEAALARRTLPDPSFAEPLRLDLARGFAAAGDAERARQLLEEFTGAVTSPVQQKATSVTRSEVLGHIALSELRYDDAIRYFRQARDGQCRSCPEAMIGRAFDEAVQIDSARAAYLRYLSAADLNRSFTDPYQLAHVLERLGDIHAERGDLERAADFYRGFVDLLREADLPLQGRVDEARAKLAGLSPPG